MQFIDMRRALGIGTLNKLVNTLKNFFHEYSEDPGSRPYVENWLDEMNFPHIPPTATSSRITSTNNGRPRAGIFLGKTKVNYPGFSNALR